MQAYKFLWRLMTESNSPGIAPASADGGVEEHQCDMVISPGGLMGFIYFLAFFAAFFAGDCGDIKSVEN